MMTPYSKVRIEFAEDTGTGVYHTFARESGTQGKERLGEDLADTLTLVPRPLVVLAKAVVETYDRREDKSKTPPLLAAARKIVAEWEEFDRKWDSGMDTASLIAAYPVDG